jgi:hypothetical protein
MCKYIKNESIDFDYKYWRMTMSLISQGYGCGIYLTIDNQRDTKGDEIDVVYSNSDAAIATLLTDDMSKVDRFEALLLDEMYIMLKEEMDRCNLEKEYYSSKAENMEKILSMKEFRKNKIDNLLSN